MSHDQRRLPTLIYNLRVSRVDFFLFLHGCENRGGEEMSGPHLFWEKQTVSCVARCRAWMFLTPKTHKNIENCNDDYISMLLAYGNRQENTKQLSGPGKQLSIDSIIAIQRVQRQRSFQTTLTSVKTIDVICHQRNPVALTHNTKRGEPVEGETAR